MSNSVLDFEKSLKWALKKGSSNYHSSNVSIFASMVYGNLRKNFRLTPDRVGDIYQACQEYIDKNKETK